MTGRASFIVPTDLGIGYPLHAHNPARDHTVEAPLIVTPARLTTPTWAAALGAGDPAVLHPLGQSWGVGDLGDLARICEIAGTGHGADFVQINPLHAAEPIPPVEDSPYLPTRRFVNPLYIRVQDIPGPRDYPKGCARNSPRSPRNSSRSTRRPERSACSQALPVETAVAQDLRPRDRR